ncbi:ankyrin repeat-containing protein BDA1-like [Salvia divinorum]|uniref:Ankyrin repeat-containing protein BDA1-like n=1 Tax=Salvia divinorum TaxID=28513 RepID=A0ABD1FPQ2_SALDI
MEMMRFAYTPLHRAAAVGNTEVALELLNLMPSLGRKLDKGGSSPLHLAIEGGHLDTARFMARFDKQLVRVKGKKGMTPLMQCAARADSKEELSLLARLLIACPESVTDVNNSNQTVVHVALEQRRCKAVCVLVEWLKRRGQISSVLSVKDLNGNTALHTAAQHGCLEGAKKLVDLVKLNRLNSKKQAALDLVTTNEMKKLLEGKGAKTSNKIFQPETTTDYVLKDATFPETVSRAFHSLSTEMTLEMRNAILVVATLIVAATYQGVLQPPGGVYPPPSNAIDTSTTKTLLTSQYYMGRRLGVSNDLWEKKPEAGQMVMERAYYRFFMPSNSFAFALSVVIVIFVVPGTPVFLILHLCLVFMCVSYLLALDAISYYTGISHMIYYMALYAIVGAYIVKLLYYPLKALIIEEDWWLRDFHIAFDNYSTTATRGFSKAILNKAYKIKKQNMVLRLSSTN